MTVLDRPRIGVLAPELAGHAEPVAEEYDVVLCERSADDLALPRPWVGVDDVDAAVAAIDAAVARNPRAAATLVDTLRRTEQLSVNDGLVTESLTYSTLLAGPEFAAWLAARDRRAVPDETDVILIERIDDVLVLTLNRPTRHNAYNRFLRDQLCDALDIALLDDSITAVQLRGAGPSFCSGGDLDEFGTTPDVVTAHLVRTIRSAGHRLHQLRDRVTVEVHGACIGAGMELPGFAGRVVARPDAYFALPEVSMGLIPGAGGTVSLPRRIGRWRTAWLALTGTSIDAETALSWGVIDEIISP